MASTTSGGYLLIDAATGWRATEVVDLVAPESATADPAPFGLESLPGAASTVFAADASAPIFPAAPAPAGMGVVYLADTPGHRIERLRFVEGRPTVREPVREVGSLGNDPRRFREPRGLAVVSGGGLAVADTGNHRVQVFSAAPYALLRVWGALDVEGRPVAGDGPGEFRWPWAVAVDRYGTVHVVDRGNARVQRFGADGTWLGELGAGLLIDPTRIALSPDGTVAVVCGVPETPGRTSGLYLFRGGEASPVGVLNLAHPRSVTYADNGWLYVGDAIGLIHVFIPDSTLAEGYRKIGEGITGVDGEVVELAWDAEIGLLAVIRETDANGTAARRRLWRLSLTGSCVPQGHLTTEWLDSLTERTHWHRISFRASLPEGTSLRVQTLVSDEQGPLTHDDTLWNETIVRGDDPDLLLPGDDGGIGRYLQLRVTLRSENGARPNLRWIKVEFPRESYLQYLPSVYQEDDESRLFLERFLAIFQTEFDAIDRRIDTIWQLFDPASSDARALPWLASWLGLTTDPTWPESTLRAAIKGAYEASRSRGTVTGLERAVGERAGVGWGKVLEHFRLRRWPELSVAAPLDGTTRLWSPDFYRRLRVSSYSRLGDFRLTNAPEPAIEPLQWEAHRFTVFFPADPGRVDEARKRVAAVVEREKPAHTEAVLCPVFPRFRVGVQATLGVDSVVATVSRLALNRLATLGYDTILSGSVAERQIQRLGTSPRPRVGLSLKLP